MADDWLMDDDAAGGSAAGTAAPFDRIAEVEYDRMTSQHEDAGYREGITQGKNQTLQLGFDAGYAIAVPLARDVGRLRGVAAAVLDLLIKRGGPPESVQKARQVVRDLGRINGVQDFDEARDRDAEAHAREHAASETAKGDGASSGGRQRERRTEAATELEQLHTSVPPALQDQRDLNDLTDAMETLAGGTVAAQEKVDGRTRLEAARSELVRLLEVACLPADIVAPEPPRLAAAPPNGVDVNMS